MFRQFFKCCSLRAIPPSSTSNPTPHPLADSTSHFVVTGVRSSFVQEVDGFSASLDPLALESDVADDRLVFFPLAPIVLPE